MRVFELKFEVRFGKNFALFVGYAFCYYVQPSHIETQKVLGKRQLLIWDNASLVEILSQAGNNYFRMSIQDGANQTMAAARITNEHHKGLHFIVGFKKLLCIGKWGRFLWKNQIKTVSLGAKMNANLYWRKRRDWVEIKRILSRPSLYPFKSHFRSNF